MAGLPGQVQQLDGSYKRVTKASGHIHDSNRAGKRLQLVSYGSQIIIIFTVVVACLVNLSLGDQKSALWSSLLSLALGCMLPNPKLRRDNVKQQQLLPSPAVEFQSEILQGQHDDSLHYTPSENGGTDQRDVGMCPSRNNFH